MLAPADDGANWRVADTRAPWAARLILGLALAMAFCVLMPGRAAAHSILVSSQPPAGSQLGTTPGTLVLTFSEPIDLSLSNATVIDPSGHPITAKPDTATEIRVNLVTNLPGLYRVDWASISLDDGHTLRGNFTFTVLARASSATTETTSGRLGAGDIALAVARWIEDVSLLLAVGMLLITWLGRRDPTLEWVDPS